MHIHNVYPYLLVKLSKNTTSAKELENYLFDFANQIDKMLNIACCMKENMQHVYNMEPVMTKSMYGYHERDVMFCKIFIYNPALIKK